MGVHKQHVANELGENARPFTSEMSGVFGGFVRITLSKAAKFQWNCARHFFEAFNELFLRYRQEDGALTLEPP